MESQKKGKAVLQVAIVIIIVALLGAAVWYTFVREKRGPFCFNFSHNMQFSSTQKVDHPVNQGRIMANGTYYLPEVPALQEALARQGFYVDQYEVTGGKVYAAAFYGPSTRAAVMAFQKKNGLTQSGDVDNATIDKLSALYKCAPSETATVTNVTLGTTTPKK